MFHHRRKGISGFTLIELAIVLGITGILFTGLWRLMSNGNQQLRDQATASQQQQLITAVSIYLASSNGQLWMGKQAAQAFGLPLPPVASPAGSTGPGGCVAAMVLIDVSGQLNGLCSILPPGFSSASVSPYGQIYNVRILKDLTTAPNPPLAYSFMIVTTGGDVISDTSGGRVSSMIGGDGGFIYSNNVCGAAPSISVWACGAYGAWSQNVTANYGFTAANGYTITSGTVASRTYYSPTQTSTTPWLARLPISGDTTNYGFNTMSWDMFVGSSAAGIPYNMNLVPFTGLGGVATTGASINMGGITAGTPGTLETSALTGGGAINMAGGTINMVNPTPATVTGGNTVNGGINMQGGTVNMVNATAPTTGGGVINLQGGFISDVSRQAAITIVTPTVGGVQQPLDQVGATPFITVGTNCTVDAVNAAFGTVNDSPACQPGLQVIADEFVTGRLTANSLYAQTFIYQGSDMRLKTNIHALSNPLDNVMKLNPVDFTFKATGQESLGVIAQDVEKVYPQLVSKRTDGMKSVNYEGLIAPLIGAVQELKRENDDLREQLRTQAVRQDRLERELKNKP